MQDDIIIRQVPKKTFNEASPRIAAVIHFAGLKAMVNFAGATGLLV
jgi:hypothetical protein